MTVDQRIGDLERLTKLRDSGALTEEEFAVQKATILSRASVIEDIRFYRRLWVVVLLTCLLITFPLAMIILLTGDVYRWKEHAFHPIGKSSRYVYGGLLALWLAAVVARSIFMNQGLPIFSKLINSGSGESTASNVPDLCDSSDAAEMVKGALEGSNSAVETVKVLDFGHAKETFFDATHNVRRCYAEAILNTGDSWVTYQLYFGPSGGELVQVEQGVRAEQQLIIDRDDKADALKVATAPATAPAQASGSASPAPNVEYSGGKYHRSTPVSADMTITRNGDMWHIAISGAGVPNWGKTPADCSLVAEGSIANGQLKANIIPFENDTMEITADDLRSTPGTVSLQLTDSGADVVQASVDPWCGAGSDLTGRYSPTP
jgi:hypothetical protein